MVSTGPFEVSYLFLYTPGLLIVHSGFPLDFIYYHLVSTKLGLHPSLFLADTPAAKCAEITKFICCTGSICSHILHAAVSAQRALLSLPVMQHLFFLLHLITSLLNMIKYCCFSTTWLRVARDGNKVFKSFKSYRVCPSISFNSSRRTRLQCILVEINPDLCAVSLS